MNKKIKDFLVGINLFWCIVSLIISIGLWFVVINTQNPEETRSYSTNVKIINYEALTSDKLIVSNLDEITSTRVSVKVRGPRLSLDQLGNNPDIKANLDLSRLDRQKGINLATGELNVSLPVGNDNIKIDSVSIRTINVKLEELVSVSKPIIVSYTGEPDNSYTIVTNKITPETITITGGKSQIEKVSKVKVFVDITGMNTDSEFKSIPLVYDENGNELKQLNLNTNEVLVSLLANVSMRTPIEVSYNGVPEKGYVVESITAKPTSIVLTGSSERLDAIDSIKIPSIDVNGKNASIQSVFYLDSILPEGIRSKEGLEKIVVDVVINPEASKEFEIPLNNDMLKGTLDTKKYEIEPTSYTLNIFGNKNELLKLNIASIGLEIDVNNLDFGTYEIVPNITIPDGFYINKEVLPIKINILPLENTTEPTDNIPTNTLEAE